LVIFRSLPPRKDRNTDEFAAGKPAQPTESGLPTRADWIAKTLLAAAPQMP
jgi:hypothetical protein